MSIEQRESLLQDLIQFIEAYGGFGSIGGEKLLPFYDGHPEHRTLLKSVGLSITGFCKQHPSRIRVGPGDGPHLRLHVLPCEQSLGLEDNQESPADSNGTEICAVEDVPATAGASTTSGTLDPTAGEVEIGEARKVGVR